jgi:hypothetical protein
MKFFIFTFFMIISTLSFGQYLSFRDGRQDYSAQNSIPVRSFENGGSKFCTVSYIFSGAKINDEFRNDSAYQFFNIDGFSKMGQVGAPALPMHNDIIAMPRGSNGIITITESEYYDYSGFMIHPALKPAKDTEGAPEPIFEKNELIYNSNNFFPEKIVEIIDIGLNRNTPLAKVQIRPIQFNPVTGIIRVYTRISYRIDYEGGLKTFDYIATENTEHYINILKLNILNSESIPVKKTRNKAELKMQGRAGAKNYIIITHSEFLPQASELANWKRQLGYSVEIVSKSSWTAQDVKDEISIRYDNWIPKPDFFLIVGDHTGALAVPGEVHQIGGENFATDLYFACMDGVNDWHPDMAHGRISISTTAEASVVVNKIINYEKNPTNQVSFYTNILNCAQYQDDDNNGYADRRFCHTSEDIRDYLEVEQSYNSERVYYTSSTANVTTLRYNNGYYSDGQLLPSELRNVSFNWAGGAAEITSAINSGKFMVFHRDHGYTGGSGWAHPYYTTTSMNSLSNGDRLPVVFSMNCHTGEYQISNCFAEKFIRMENKGAVGVVAAAYYSYSGFNDALSEGMIDAIWADPGLYPDFGSGGTGNNYSIGAGNEIYTMGDVVNQGLYAMEQNWDGANSEHNYQYELYHWFGDPAMKIWTANPNFNAITASHSSNIDCSGNTFTILQSTPGAKATLVYNNNIIGQIVLDASGNGTINYSITSPGTLVVLTISKHNNKPYINNLTVIGTCVFPPSVETLFASTITNSTATANGTILDDYGDVVIESGFVYSLNPQPTINGAGVFKVITAPLITMGPFSVNLTGLSSSTIYFVRAYAINANGTSYGEDISFETDCGMTTNFPVLQDFNSWAISTPDVACTPDGTVGFYDCWTNVTGDDIDWEIFTGPTASGSTGPSSGYSGSGNYIYTEASYCYNKVGYIRSVNFNLSALNSCELKFYYHMYGANMGSLSVQVSTDGGNTWSADLWSKAGDQGDLWKEAIISLNNYVGYNDVLIQFKGVTGPGYKSDMALDQISVYEMCTPPSQQATALASSNINENAATINWSRGTGDRVLIVIREGDPISAEPTIGVNYTANSEFGSGDEIGTGNFVVYNGTGNFVTIIGLNAGTQYFFEIFEYYENGLCYLLSEASGDFTTAGVMTCSSHCLSSGNMVRQTATTFVGINMLSNTSGKTLPYNDYTDLETYLIKENSYQISVKVNTDGDYNVETNVWIDWNNDCDFDDAGEYYDMGNAKNVSNGYTNLSPLNFTVPVNAINGKVKMRVSAKRDSDPTSCQIDYDGEVEDYSLVIGVIQSMWLGYNADWHDPTNWGDGLVPDIADDVVVPVSPIGGIYPSINNGTIAECKSIFLENGASIEVGGTLIIAD